MKDLDLLLASFNLGIILENLSTVLSVILLLVQIFVILFSVIKKIKSNKDLKVEDLEVEIEDLEQLINKIDNMEENRFERESGNGIPEQKN